MLKKKLFFILLVGLIAAVLPWMQRGVFANSFCITVKVLGAMSGSIKINNGATYTNTPDVTLNLSATNVAQMCFSNDSSSWSDWEDYITTKSWTLASADGEKTVYVKFRNVLGTESDIYSDSIILDTTPPTVAVASPKEDAIVNKEINVKGTANDIHFKQYELEYGSGGGSSWIEIVGSTSPVSDDTLGIWYTTLVSDGSYTLRLLAEDEADNTNEVRIKIKVDNNPPVTVLTEYPEKIIAANMAKVDVIFAWAGSDPSGITPPENLVYQYKLEGYDSNGLGNWSDWVFEKTKIYALPAGDYVFKVRAKDEVGNYPDEDDEATAKCSFKVSLPVVVYPSPVYPDRGDVVKIANLPLNSVVYIYSIVGELIRALDTPGEVVEEGGSATAIWDCRNDFGEMVARGVYIYYCPKVIGNRKTGKSAIIR